MEGQPEGSHRVGGGVYLSGRRAPPHHAKVNVCARCMKLPPPFFFHLSCTFDGQGSVQAHSQGNLKVPRPSLALGDPTQTFLWSKQICIVVTLANIHAVGNATVSATLPLPITFPVTLTSHRTNSDCFWRSLATHPRFFCKREDPKAERFPWN